MSRLHVCSLARLAETAAASGARSLMTLLSPGMAMQRPAAIARDRHLVVGVSDIVEPLEGLTQAAEQHLAAMLAFFRGWDRADPLLIHCYAGVSRSTAAAAIAVCALAPSRSETAVARALRLASPTATPNARLIALADAALRREGRLIAAIQGIGRGADCFEGAPFALDV